MLMLHSSRVLVSRDNHKPERSQSTHREGRKPSTYSDADVTQT